MKSIVKRNGEVVDFQPEKITEAIFKAMISIDRGDLNQAQKLTEKVLSKIYSLKGHIGVEDVQDTVIKVLMEANSNGKTFEDVAEVYILYRENRKTIREEKYRIDQKSRQASASSRNMHKSANTVELHMGIMPKTVTNRQEQRVPIDVRKIRSVISEACDGLAQIDPLILEMDSQIHFYEGISTGKIQETLIRIANEETSINEPEWTMVAARLLLHDLYNESRRNRSQEKVYTGFYDLLRNLTASGKIDPRILDTYSKEEIDDLQNYMKPERDRLFPFAGIKLLSDRYCIRGNRGEVLELPQETFMGIAIFLSLAENKEKRVEWAKRFYDILSELNITMATPTLANARRRDGQLSSCFIDTPEDSLQGIFDGLTTFAKVSQNGGGMGVYLGKLRSLGSAIRGYEGAGSGVIPWVRLYNDTAVSVNQLGQRAGAISIWLDLWHKDILDFLDLKTNSGDERRKAHDVFPGVCVPDLFYRELEKDGVWHLIDPHEIREKKGYSLEDFWGDEWEQRYVDICGDNSISKKDIRALDLMEHILRSLYETGTPFFFNRDTVNRMNPNKHEGIILSSNLCTEICQNQSSTTLDAVSYNGKTVTESFNAGDLVVCNLSSLNLGRTDTVDKIREVVPIQVRMLDNVITLNNLPLSQAKITNARYRAIGVGISGYHQYLVSKGIPWESEEHLIEVDKIFEEINYVAIRASMELARERGAYPLFKGSDWYNGEYFRLRNYDSQRWKELARDVHESGIRNGYIMAIAPTGSTSIIAGSTAGIDPVFQPVFVEEKKGFIIKQVAPDLNSRSLPLYKGAHSIDQLWIIRAAAIRQKHLDQSQSLNIFATADLDQQGFLKLYYEAWKLGVKMIYYFRNFTEDESVSGVSSCESCEA